MADTLSAARINSCRIGIPLPPEILRRARMLWINYPNNPTGAVAERKFYEDTLAFAAQYGILVCSDAAYCDVAFDGYSPASMLEVSGAMSAAIEFTSVSKTYNMAGWRLGFLAGNAEVVAAVRKVKSNIDSGIFAGITAAGEVALRGDQSWLVERNALYARRRDMVLAGLAAVGIVAEPPKASLYVWAPVPEGWASEAFASEVLESTGVCFSPGTFLRRGRGRVYRESRSERRPSAWKKRCGG